MNNLRSSAAILALALGAVGCASSRTARVVSEPGDGVTADRLAGSGPFLYVANQEAAAVTVIDQSTNEIWEIIDLEAMGYGANAKPHHIAVEPDGSYWYVSLIAANQVLKFDRDNEFVSSVEFERPGLLALHPTEDWLFVGRSMAAVNPPQRIGRIGRTSMEIEEFEVFIPRPHALQPSPDGQWIYTGSLGENSVVTVEAESGDAELLRLPSSGTMPHVLVQYAVSPDGQTLVATAEMTAKLLIFDVTDPTAPELRLDVDVGARPWHPVFSADGRWIWFGNLGTNEVTLVDTRDWTVAAVVEGDGLAEPHGSVLSADGRRLYVANRNEKSSFESTQDFGYEGPNGTVVIIDTSTREIIEVIETPPYAAGVALASESR